MFYKAIAIALSALFIAVFQISEEVAADPDTNWPPPVVWPSAEEAGADAGAVTAEATATP